MVKKMRFVTLVLVSLTMMFAYFFTDVMSPLESLLTSSPETGGLSWSSDEYGFFSGSYGFFNVFLLLLFFGGVVLDKFGIRFTGVLSSLLMFGGALIKWWAVSHSFEGSVALPFSLGVYSTQVIVASLGFAIFGVGAEIACITATKVIVKWFTGKEMALAMGIQVALARLGTALALAGSPAIAQRTSLPMPILLGVLSVGIGLIAYLFYCQMDRRIEREGIADEAGGDDEQFHLRDLKATLGNGGFWLITLLCMLYYSALYPFLDFATKLMIEKYGVSPELAGTIPAILPFTSIVLTPLFGGMYDRMGRGATIMIAGTVMLTVVLMVFALPLHSSALAVAMMFVLGIAFSLLPSVLWPAVPKIVPTSQLGTAYSVIYYIQNIGLMVVPVLIGTILDRNTHDGHIDYSPAMWVFTVIGIAAIIISVMLLGYDRRHHIGLEQSNLQHNEERPEIG